MSYRNSLRSDPLDCQEAREAAASWGLGGVHAMGADEILMWAEEAPDTERLMQQCGCVCAVLQSLTVGVGNVEEIRDRVVALAAQVDASLLEGEPGLVRGAEGRRRLGRVVLVETWEEVSGRGLLRVILAQGWSMHLVGRRVLCLLYALQRNPALRPGIALNFESIGRATGSKARNPRSGVSAAMKEIVGELLAALTRRERPGDAGKLWFAKRAECREKLKVSMKGKRNRAGKGRKMEN